MLADQATAPRRPRRLAARLALALWVPGVSAILATQMVPHWVPLPAPSRAAERPASALGALLDQHAAEGWQRVHVLYADCGCSARVLDDLLANPADGPREDFVLLVGDAVDDAERTRAAGLPFEVVDAEQLERRFGIVAAPLLLIFDPARQLVYSGGHTDRKRGFALRSESLLEQLKAGEAPADLPAFGCAVSRELQAQLDPLGLKY
ncbi:MAG: hypothetical protein AAFZ65_00290 [Planctomycetota bacterium]